jgi:lysylphosphatidylglycerol synthetase-like protein (DUF2156 family)
MTVVAMTETPNDQTEKKSSMNFGTEKLMNLIVVLFAVFGAFLNFVGICIQQANSNRLNTRVTFVGVGGTVSTGSVANNIFDEQWYHTFFYIAVLIAFCVLTMVTNFDQHRMTMMAFLVVGFVYLTDDLNRYIIRARAEEGVSSSDNFTQGGPGTSFTGCLFMTFSWFYMMIFTGGMPSIPSFSK